MAVGECMKGGVRKGFQLVWVHKFGQVWSRGQMFNKNVFLFFYALNKF